MSVPRMRGVGGPVAIFYPAPSSAPPSQTTPALLALLAQRGAKATFFMSAADALANLPLVRAILAGGHEVGALGMAGPHWTSEVLADIEATKAVLESAAATSKQGSTAGAAGSSVAWYRPQDGSRDARVLRAANRAGLAVALWSLCPFDWDAAPGEVAARLREQVAHTPAGGRTSSGAIVCLQARVPDYLAASTAAHRPKPDVVAAARQAMDVLQKDERVALITLSELCPEQGLGMEAI
jgi:peptidoglycan/xylan/chitin deacetylase (PgdA/CDA1 family)